MRFFAKNTTGNNRVFPGGSTCYVNINMIPPFVICSSSSEIPSEILTNELKSIDEHLDLD